MNKYLVTIKEVLTYEIEVEATDKITAEYLALHSEDFASNNFKDNDADVVSVEKIS